jgi:hypothetical protein
MERTDKTQHETRALTRVEALFVSAGLPATEVEACPDERCPICHADVPKAA